MAGTPDPFRVLSLPYEASPDDVRRAFRSHARRTHPDRGGSVDAFHEVRVAYAALSTDLDGARRRWRTAPPPAPAPRRHAAGLDPRTYPTCPIKTSGSREGQRVAYLADQRPRGWRPGAEPPPGGTCVARVAATAAMPAFGVWRVPLDAERVRYVFGPTG